MKKLISFVITMGCVITLSAQWHFHNPLPQGNTLRDVYFFDLNNGLAVGDGGTLLKTWDGGLSWEFVTVPTKNDLYAITFIESHIGFICGSGGTILRTSDGGESWEEMTSGTSIILRDIYFHSSPWGYAVGDNGTIIITYNCGFSWNVLNSNTIFNLHSLYCPDPLEAYVVGDNGTILYTFNGGAVWNVQESGTTESLYKVVFKDDHTGWITGNAGIILKTVNAGESWLLQESGTQTGLYGLCMFDDEKGWAVGQNGIILCTTDGGSQWTSQVSNSDQSLNAVCAVDDQNCFIAGDNGDQFLTNDGGKTWISQSSGFHDPVNLRFAGFTDDLHGWACDGSGDIMRTSNGGSTWTVSGTNPGASDLVFTDLQQGWLAGGWGGVYHTNDGGLTWEINYTSSEDDSFSNIFFISPDTGWVGGWMYYFTENEFKTKYVILKTTDGGQSWSRKTVSIPVYFSFETRMFDLLFKDPLHGWAIGWTFGFTSNWEDYIKVEILRTVNGGTTWSLIQTDLEGFFEGEWGIYFVSNTTGYAWPYDLNRLYKSTNNGASWTEIFSEIEINDLYFSDPENGWAVGYGGKILRTTDGGLNWTQQPSPTGYRLNRILFTDNGDGWIFGENSTILYLADTTMVSVKEHVRLESLSVSVFPNPFSGSTLISYNLDEECHVNLIVYNYAGQMISELVNERQSKGNQQLIWNGGNLPAGIYFYRLIAGNLTSAGKVEKLK